MNQEETRRFHGRNVQHLSRMASYYSHMSPAVSRFFMSSANEIVQKKSAPSSDSGTSFCPHCGSIYDAENHTVRILPKMKQTKTVKRLLKKQKLGGQFALDSNERHLLDDYASSRSQISITCKICHQRHLVECLKRPPKPVIEEATPEVKKKKKKKRKKDVTCGIIISTPKSQPGSETSSPSLLYSSFAKTPTSDAFTSQPRCSKPTPTAAREKPSQKDIPVLLQLGPSSVAARTPGGRDRTSVTPKSGFTKPSPSSVARTTPGQHLVSSGKKKTKMKHTQLQHILNQEKKKNASSSSSLHNFLSSL
ncbi:UPF0711 protein C18orf21 homolog [Lineus longissimus]|uniref:UPF0711 protein C18orf21 homolog n=1 Tax=Lineus longissimus TaxID=88925 RepID=UPI002B4E809D